MFSAPRRYEIDHRTIKLIVGLIALFLANVTGLLSRDSIDSISASYYVDGWARDVFVGSLFAISAFMAAYNGQSAREMWLSKIAAIAALGVALFPCQCGDHPEFIHGLHWISAGIMFCILAALCYAFRQRARAKAHREAMRRAYIYDACGIAIVVSIVAVMINAVSGGAFVEKWPRFIFYCEYLGLFSFGIAWLTASRILPWLTVREERFAPWSDSVVE